MKNLGPKEIICNAAATFTDWVVLNDIYSPKIRVLDFYTKQPR